MKSAILISAAAFVAALAAFQFAASAEKGDGDSELVGALAQAKLPLEHGIAASAREGVPISAKYETEDDGDDLQLSVYTMKSGYDVDFETGDVKPTQASFSEVIVDYSTGKISKVIPIRGGEDLNAATSQRQAMAQAARSLESATAHAVAANKGYRAVSAMPALENGHPVVKVLLLGGSEWKTVYEKLD
jgi:hypothetical protein